MLVLGFGAVGFAIAIVINELTKDYREKRYQKKLAARAAARRSAR